MMDILIITNFTSTFSKTDNDRFLYIAKMLSKENDVEIVTSDFCHEKKEKRDKTESEWSFKITFLHEPGYPTNVCLKRFYSHYIWGKSVKEYLKTRKKPDVIYCAVPSLSGPFQAAKYCKKNNVRFNIDVQDLWPEAFKMVFNVPVISPLIFAPFKVLANYIYKNADEIVAVSQTYVDRALNSNKKCMEGYSVFLGTELQNFDRLAKGEIKMKKNKDELWLGYCGTLGSSYDITCVFDALDILKKRKNQTPKFIVMGDGPLKEKFEEFSNKHGIDSIFTGRLPYDEMCKVLSNCDIVVNPISHGAAQSIINKHADYVASGKPIISTQESPEFKGLITEYDMGDNCRNNDPMDLAEKILKYTTDENMRMNKGKNARRCAEEKFDRATTYKVIFDLIMSSKRVEEHL